MTSSNTSVRVSGSRQYDRLPSASMTIHHADSAPTWGWTTLEPWPVSRTPPSDATLSCARLSPERGGHDGEILEGGLKELKGGMLPSIYILSQRAVIILSRYHVKLVGASSNQAGRGEARRRTQVLICCEHGLHDRQEAWGIHRQNSKPRLVFLDCSCPMDAQ